MHTFRTAGRVLVVAVLALAVVACGGGDDDEADSTTTTTAAEGSGTETTEAPTGDAALPPCNLLTTAEIEEALGVAVVATHLPADGVERTLESCYWAAPGESQDSEQHQATIELQVGDGYDASVLESAPGVGAVTPIEGLGDGAILIPTSDGYRILRVLVGDTLLQVSVSGPIDPALTGVDEQGLPEHTPLTPEQIAAAESLAAIAAGRI